MALKQNKHGIIGMESSQRWPPANQDSDLQNIDTALEQKGSAGDKHMLKPKV